MDQNTETTETGKGYPGFFELKYSKLKNTKIYESEIKHLNIYLP
jgi:hypothetical protein